MNFLKTFLASLLALVIFTVVGFVLFFIILGALTAEEKVVVRSNSVLHLNLDAQISEQQVDDPFATLLGNEIKKIGLLELKQVIKSAGSDEAIKGIYLNVSYPMAGFSTLQEVRQSLLDFRASGKWVIAYADVMSESAYYLASAADDIFLNPQGEVELNGLALEVIFFKRLFDKLEIKPEVFRVGEFKSAVEPFLLDKMSDENRLQLNEMVNSINSVMLNHMSESRAISIERLKEISDKMLVRNASLALEHQLVDSLVYQDQVEDVIKEKLGLAPDKKISFIKYNRYKKAVSSYSSSQNEIAVIVAEGTIMPGKDQEGIAGSTTFVEELRKARESKRVKAIVLRINSPGGSFQASDVMWREIQLASATKPVIASMSDYAASGGYYLAMGCDTIVAQPHTITGSIGIFSVLFDASGFLNNKLGITSEEVKTGEYGELITISRPLTPAEKNVWQRRTEELYETFAQKAADGRKVSVEEIKRVASGRVWTGEQAIERKLVDILGGYDDAIRIAAEHAGVTDNYRVKIYPRQKPFIEQLMTSFEENARTEAIQEKLGVYYPYYQQLQTLKTFEGEQARMPFVFQIH